MEYIVRETAYQGAIDTQKVGEIVRCANCKYLQLSDKGYRCPVGFFSPTEEDYCSKGVRIDAMDSNRH